MPAHKREKPRRVWECRALDERCAQAQGTGTPTAQYGLEFSARSNGVNEMQVQGRCDAAFEPVRQAFAAILDEPHERGGGVCIQVGGKTVVDIWGGVKDAHGHAPWQRDTLVNAYCTIKPITAVAVLMLVERGRLGLDDPVAKHWPEFARHGKERITLRQVLSHTSGLPALRLPDRTPHMYDWNHMAQVTADEQPWWSPGTQVGYGATTYGWIIGELIRRVDGRDAGIFIHQEILEPHALDVFLGVPADQFKRIAHFEHAPGRVGDRFAQDLRSLILNEPAHVATLAFTNPSLSPTRTGNPRWWGYHQPGVCSHGNAHGLAGFYSALLQGKLLGPQLLKAFGTEQSAGFDQTLRRPMRYGLGCMMEHAADPDASYCMGPQAFGHVGLGGPVAFADPDREMSFGFVTTTMGSHVLMDPRARTLAALAFAAVE